MLKNTIIYELNVRHQVVLSYQVTLRALFYFSCLFIQCGHSFSFGPALFQRLNERPNSARSTNAVRQGRRRDVMPERLRAKLTLKEYFAGFELDRHSWCLLRHRGHINRFSGVPFGEENTSGPFITSHLLCCQGLIIVYLAEDDDATRRDGCGPDQRTEQAARGQPAIQATRQRALVLIAFVCAMSQSKFRLNRNHLSCKVPWVREAEQEATD